MSQFVNFINKGMENAFGVAHVCGLKQTTIHLTHQCINGKAGSEN